jgi:hypothetical protein
MADPGRRRIRPNSPDDDHADQRDRLSSQSVPAEAGLDPTAPGNIATLTLIVGVVMTLTGCSGWAR